MVPKILQAEPNVLCRVCDTGKLDGACREALQLETQNRGAKHSTVARRAIVTCCRRVMIVFAGICKEKT